MNIVISSRIDKPIYEQIYEQISSQIINSELESDYCLPSIRVVAKELGISVITVKKAWEMLEYNQFIYTMAGKGCFVKAHAKKHLEDKKFTLASEQLKKDIPYYKNLGLSYDELTDLIKKEY